MPTDRQASSSTEWKAIELGGVCHEITVKNEDSTDQIYLYFRDDAQGIYHILDPKESYTILAASTSTRPDTGKKCFRKIWYKASANTPSFFADWTIKANGD